MIALELVGSFKGLIGLTAHLWDKLKFRWISVSSVWEHQEICQYILLNFYLPVCFYAKLGSDAALIAVPDAELTLPLMETEAGSQALVTSGMLNYQNKIWEGGESKQFGFTPEESSIKASQIKWDGKYTHFLFFPEGSSSSLTTWTVARVSSINDCGKMRHKPPWNLLENAMRPFVSQGSPRVNVACRSPCEPARLWQ